jgi:anaerobic magnesium-protoporphyrin IX monomethyl ester cyclase
MAKILFINPVVREEDVPRHIPYGIALLAAIAIRDGHLVQVYDANAWRTDLSVVADVSKADKWDVIAIGGLTTTYGFIKDACQLIRKHAPNALLVAGGGFLTSMPNEIMEWIPEIDLGVVGEAFLTFPEVLEKVDAKENDWKNVLGVIWRDETGDSHLNQVRPNIADLDKTIPHPAWDLFPLEEVYFKNSASLFSEEAYYAKRRIDVNGSYGCSLVCKYCWHLGTTGDMVIEKQPNGKNAPVFTYGRNIRYHSPDYIIEMVQDLKGRYNIDFVNFLDENLMTMDQASGRSWLAELCAKWIEGGLQPDCRRLNVRYDQVENNGVFWAGTSHASLHRPETLKLMHEAGCTHLVYGLESFSSKVLKKLGKGSNPKKNRTAVDICLESGIKPIPNIIIGFPEEDFESIRDTIEALIDLGIHAKPHFATAYPGSEWYYRYRDEIINQYDGDLEKYILDLGDASKITATISHNFSGMELMGLQGIVATRDLRLLKIAEAASERKNRSESIDLVKPSPTTEFKAKRITTPLQIIS